MLLALAVCCAPLGVGLGCSSQTGLKPNFDRFNQRVEGIAESTRRDTARWVAFLETVTPERIAEELHDAGDQVLAVASGVHQDLRQDVIDSRRRMRRHYNEALAYETRMYERAPQVIRQRLRLLLE